jgi:dienelactone hydrolase
MRDSTGDLLKTPTTSPLAPLLALLLLLATGCSSYRTEEVVVRNGETELGGTLYLPAGKGPHPAVVFIHGSGPSTRENVRFFAELFARHGIAALAHDKRDVGGGAAEFARRDQLVGDALAAVELLRARPDIDPARVGLWGGSLGGGLAARAAARSKSVAFIISVSGGGVSLAQFRDYQLANRLRARGFSETEVREAMGVVEELHEYARHGGKDRERMQAALDRAFERPWARAVLPRRAPSPDDGEPWAQWSDLDGSAVLDWERVNVPVLAVWGARDALVPVEPSAANIRAALERAGNRDVTIRVVPDADHNLMLPGAAPTDLPSQEYLDLMIDWTRKRVGK